MADEGGRPGATASKQGPVIAPPTAQRGLEIRQPTLHSDNEAWVLGQVRHSPLLEPPQGPEKNRIHPLQRLLACDILLPCCFAGAGVS